MAMIFLNSTALLQNAQKEQLYGKLLVQLEKDFGLANVPIDFPLDITPDDLKTILQEKLYFLILEKFTDYLKLLYIVDVPEKTLKEIQVPDIVKLTEQVSFLILKREWQKVWFKTKYNA